jgi:hypothetical protein
VDDLRERGLVPAAQISPALMPRIEKLRKALSHAALIRNLKRRLPLNDIQQAGVLKSKSSFKSYIL